MTVITGDGQYSIDGFAFGRAQNYIQIQQTQIQPATPTTQDVPLPNADATWYGVDAVPSNTITFTGFARKDGDELGTLQAYQAFSAMWLNPVIRLTANTFSELQLFYKFSSEVRVVWGRCRGITPTLGLVNQSTIPFTASFVTVSPFFYTLAQSGVTLDTNVNVKKGLVPPVRVPAVSGATVDASHQQLSNSGELPTYPVITFRGPVANPQLSFSDVGKWIGYTGVLKAGQSLAVDTRPWIAQATRNDGASVAGDLAGTASMADLVLPAGRTNVAFTGNPITTNLNPTVYTIRCQVAWWNAHASIGG